MNTNTKKKLQIFFSIVGIKMATKIYNSSHSYINLDFFREEIKSLVLLTVLNKTKLLVFTALVCPKRKIEIDLDLSIYTILKSSLEEIMHKLKIITMYAPIAVKMETVNAIILEDSMPFLHLITVTIAKKNLPKDLSRIILFSIETLVIKLTNEVMYQLNLTLKNFPAYSYYFYKDYVFFKENLKNYVMYRLYTEHLLLSIRALSSRTCTLSIIHKKKLVLKEIYNVRVYNYMKSSISKLVSLNWRFFTKFLYLRKSSKNFFEDC
uniref:Uncharacterized protein n=1 Tax=Cryptomonas sp. SAG 977-2f TaxID=279061 RepID=A0A679CC39_9CRYP|nr:hypothetical protein CrySAG9772f_p087 [Cryptomonas sp. SAG 977-2f]